MNSGGLPASGLYDFRFRLAADALGNTYVGSAFYTNGIAVTNGLFLTTVDFGAGIFTGGTNWLEVDVKTNLAGSYIVLSPLQSVTPTPNAVFAEAAGSVSGVVSASQLSGAVASGNLPPSPTVSGTVTAGAFTGSGANLTGVNAAKLNGLNAANFWQTGGNSGTTAGVNFLGTTDSQPVELWVNGARALRLQPGNVTSGAPNVIGGSVVNYINSGVDGSVIAGGGATNYYGYGGVSNSIFESFCTVSGGDQNTIQYKAFNSTIGGGFGNLIQTNALDSTISGGNYNVVETSAAYATIGGGFRNTILGGTTLATIPGGQHNFVGGNGAFAAGQFAQALHAGSFVWSDSQGSPFQSAANDTFNIRAQGGVFLDNSTPAINFGGTTKQMLNLYGLGYGIGIQSNTEYFRTAGGFAWFLGGVHDDAQNNPGAGGTAIMTLDNLGNLECAGTVYSQGVALTSDRNAKENFQPVDNQTVLAKVAALPVTQWNYKTDSKGVQHIGPMAQDFQAAFGLDGADDKHISVVDEGGVALAAIQGLNQKLEQKETEITELKARLEKLEQLINAKTGGGQ